MATPEELKNASKAAQELNAELNAINSAVASLNDELKIVVQETEFFDKVTKSTANTFQKDLSKALDNVRKNNEKITELQKKQLNDQKLSSSEQKQLAILLKRQAADRQKTENAINNLRGEGVDISVRAELAIQEQLDASEALGASTSQLNTNLIAQRGITGAIVDNFKEYVNKLDKSGVLTKLFNGELNTTQKLSLASEAAFIAIAKAALEGSDRINDLQKNLGISYSSAYQLQNSLAITAGNSEKLFVTSKDLNKAFTDLAAQTGLLADFGGDTLVTFTALTKQLGLGTNEASQLALLARTQGKDTEGILDNTVDTVNAINKQNKSAISAKAVLNDIATASKSIVVSLGMSPEILAEAATEARALGLNLETVDKIAGSLLDFESSIAAELEAEVLLGKDINLEKARQAALTNDLATLSQEIGKNEGVINAFATGNRIQQEAAAKALGLSREELSGMVMQQEIMNLSQDEFIAKYGEQSYQQMQAQSASEKFAASMEKIQGIIGDIGTTLSPIIDGFASVVGFLAKSKVAAIALVGVLSGLAVLSIIKSIAEITASSFFAGPIAGPAIAAASIAGLFAAIGAGTSLINAQKVNDGIAPAGNGPFTITDSFGATAITAKGDGIAVSPNISQGSGDGITKAQANEMITLLRQVANKDFSVTMDGRKLNTAMQTSGVASIA